MVMNSVFGYVSFFNATKPSWTSQNRYEKLVADWTKTFIEFFKLRFQFTSEIINKNRFGIFKIPRLLINVAAKRKIGYKFCWGPVFFCSWEDTSDPGVVFGIGWSKWKEEKYLLRCIYLMVHLFVNARFRLEYNWKGIVSI